MLIAKAAQTGRRPVGVVWLALLPGVLMGCVNVNSQASAGQPELHVSVHSRAMIWDTDVTYLVTVSSFKGPDPGWFEAHPGATFKYSEPLFGRARVDIEFRPTTLENQSRVAKGSGSVPPVLVVTATTPEQPGLRATASLGVRWRGI